MQTFGWDNEDLFSIMVLPSRWRSVKAYIVAYELGQVAMYKNGLFRRFMEVLLLEKYGERRVGYTFPYIKEQLEKNHFVCTIENSFYKFVDSFIESERKASF